MLLVNCHRVKPGELDRLREWLIELSDRSDEVRETFRQETVRHEQALILPPSEVPILIYAIEAEDLEAGRSAYESSRLEIDQQHRRVMDTVLERPATVERLYDVAL